MKKILCIGHSAYDITIPMDHYPIQNNKYRITDVVENGGGSANNCAYLLSMWGQDVYYAGIVGNDVYGKKIIKELKSVGVNLKFLEINKTYETLPSYIIVNTTNGSRTILGKSNPNSKISIKKINMKPDIILVDGYHYELAKRTLEENKNAIKIIDAGKATDEIIELSKLVDYLVCSRDFVEKITNKKIDLNDENTYKEIYNEIELMFNNHLIITIGHRGSIYKINNEIKVMPPYNVVAKDTTGAGDIFHGAFTYCIANNFDIEKTMKIANITGALSTTKIGGKNSMPPLNEVMRIYENNEL
ncbi:MAG: PfkB family carbohydrate kinase [Bacilli bacterium]|nr:PfkB family carbohydrate kinase [Bacilli bacterium]